jgi:hypothetical protein
MEPVLQQHFWLIFGRGVGDHPVAGVVVQLAAAPVVGQFRAGLVAASPARPPQDEPESPIDAENGRCQ